MRFLVSALIGCALVLTGARVAGAACGDRPGDPAAVAATRAAADAGCDCATAAWHGAYVDCAAGVANEAVRTDSPCGGSGPWVKGWAQCWISRAPRPVAASSTPWASAAGLR